jgi:hypothetical protein
MKKTTFISFLFLVSLAVHGNSVSTGPGPVNPKIQPFLYLFQAAPSVMPASPLPKTPESRHDRKEQKKRALRGAYRQACLSIGRTFTINNFWN